MLNMCCLQKRYVFAIMGFLTSLIGYMMQLSLEITLPHMVNRTITAEQPLYDPSSCPDIILIPNHTNIIPFGSERPGTFQWDENTQQSVSSIFRTSYVMTQFIGGIVAERRGGKNIVGFSIVILSLATSTIPLGSKLLGSSALYVLRLISGGASGIFIPAFISMMSKWVPADERAFVGSLVFPGSYIGFIAASTLSQLLILYLGWEAVYYLFGFFGLVLSLLWKKLVFSTPTEHPDISEAEKKYLNDNLVSLKRLKKYDLDPLPWKSFLRSGVLWGTVIGYIGHEWAYTTLMFQVPQFMKDVLRFDFAFSPFFLYMPYVCIWLGALLMGFTCDIIVKKKVCSITNARKIFTGIGSVGAAFSIAMVMYSGCSPEFTLLWLYIGLVACGAYHSGCIINAVDFAPNYAGSAMAVIDNIAMNSVLLIPQIGNVIITDALLQQWRLFFWIVIVLLVISVNVYFYYAKGDQQWWDDVRKNGYPENWKHGLLGCEGSINENGESIYKVVVHVAENGTKRCDI